MQFARRFLLVALLALAPAGVRAQFPSPELETIFPPGGKPGATFQAELTGTDLDDLTALRFTHPGITGESVILPADEIWPEPRPDGLKFTVRIGNDVPAGLHEVRTIGRFGLSTPRFFVVSPKDGPAELTVADGNETSGTATPLALEQVVNAQTKANRSDHYKLAVRKGQRVLIHVWGERLDSRLDAILSVHDPAGKQIAISLNEIGLDPLGDFTAQVDGDYLVKVSDYLYNGGPPYYYRLMATTAPYLDGVFPPSGKAGTRQKFTIYGRNLPGGQPGEVVTTHGAALETKEVEIQVPAAGGAVTVNGGKILQAVAEGFEWRDGASNPVRIGLAHDELVVEDSKLDEQAVRAPCEVVGRFDRRGDQDRYRFSATKDEALVIEVIAERMGIAVDPTLIVQQIVKPTPDAPDQKESSKFIAEADDIVLKSLIPLDGPGFDTRSRDARILFTAPEDGDYRVVVGNNMSHAGALAPYRLGIRKARPGFRLIAVQDKNWQEGRNAMPGVTRVNAGGTNFIRILALRDDGFEGPIELAVRGLPTGVYAPPISIWGPNDEGYLVISAASHAQDWMGDVEITGKASLEGMEVSVTALAGTLVWSAQDPTKNRTRSRQTTRFPLQVSSEPAGLVLQVDETKIWRVELKKTLDLPVTLTKQGEVKGPFKVTPYGLPGFTRPPAPNLSGEKGVVKIGFNPDGNNKPRASEGRFVFRLDAVQGKYRANPMAFERWTAWKKEIDAKANQFNADKNKANNAVNTANNARTTAERAVTDHAGARNKLAQAVTAAQAKVDAAKQTAETAGAAAKAVPEAWLGAVKAAHDANQAARPAVEKAATDAQTKAEDAKKKASDTDTARMAEVTAIEEAQKTLRQAVDTANTALKSSRDALAAAEKALADHLAPRVALANVAAGEEIRLRVAKHAAGLAASEVGQVIAEHDVTTKLLTEVKTKAEAALKQPEQALANATKGVTDKETAKAAMEKTLADARTKLETLKKAATDANAAMTATVTAHGENLTKLTQAKGAADRLATEAAAGLEAAKKAQAAQANNEDQAVKAQLAQAVTDAQSKETSAMKAVTDAASAIQGAESAHKTNLAKLIQAKSKAESDAKSAETAVASATKSVADAENSLEGLKKTQAEAQAKFDDVKKVADEAAAAIPAEANTHAAHLGKLSAAKVATAKSLQTVEPVYTAAAKRVTDHDADKKNALEKAVADAKAKIEPARKPLVDAESKLAQSKGARDSALAKLTAEKRSADLALVVAETVKKSADQLLVENQTAATALSNSLSEAQATAEAAKQAAAAAGEGDKAVPPAKIAELGAAATSATASLATAITALAKAKQSLDVHEASKPHLEEVAAETKTLAEGAKAEAKRLTELVDRANAAKTLAATELRDAQNKANEKDVKFSVYSEPIDLRVLEPPAKK